MKLLLCSVLLLVTFSNCTSEASKFGDDDPRSLIGRWEIVKKYYENQKIFNLEDGSHSRKIIKGMENYFIHFKKDNKVKCGVWINDSETPTKYTESGIYELDPETKRVRIEVRNFHKPILLGGSFRWKIKGQYLYLYSTNHRSGTYQVYRRSE